MQNFSLEGNKKTEPARGNGSVDISVSGVFEKDGRRMAYVSFSDGKRSAEGTIPDCVITANKGFSADETGQLEDYMKRELTSLKKMASGINVMKALMD